MKLRHLGIFGIVSLLSCGAMVFISPLAYPGYDPFSMAISDLSAVGAPSAPLAERLNALYGPAALVCIMAVCRMFPLVMGEEMTSFQNVMHILVTVLVVLFSVLSLVLTAAGGRKEGRTFLSLMAALCLACMAGGAGSGDLSYAEKCFRVF